MSSCIQTNISFINNITIGIISSIIACLVLIMFALGSGGRPLTKTEKIKFFSSALVYILFFIISSIILTNYGKIFLCGNYQYLLFPVPFLTFITSLIVIHNIISI